MADMMAITHKLENVEGRDVHAELIDAFASRAANPAALDALVDEMWEIAPEIGEDYVNLVDWLEFRGFIE